MSEFAEDAVFSNLEITRNIIHNGKVILDTGNGSGSTLYIDSIVTSNVSGVDLTGIRKITGVSSLSVPIKRDSDPPIATLSNEHSSVIGKNNIQSNNKTVIIGGELNENFGEYSSILGGKYNELYGKQSTIIGGIENKIYSSCSISMGQSAICSHDNSFVFNSSENELETTDNSQFIIGSNNGTFFKLPQSAQIKSHLLPEGFACWCWDHNLNSVVMKTKQNDNMYISIIPTKSNNIEIKLQENNGYILPIIINPDTDTTK